MRLIGGEFLLIRKFRRPDMFMPNIPKEKEYLRHYFKTDPEKAFVPYWICFSFIYFDKGEEFFYNCFLDHTGIAIPKNLLQSFISKIFFLEDLFKKAQDDMDFELIQKINTGNHEICFKRQ